MEKLRSQDEKITAAAIKFRGQVFSGFNHLLILEQITSLNPNIADEELNELYNSDSGFVTDKGRFISRKEAHQISKEDADGFTSKISEEMDSSQLKLI